MSEFYRRLDEREAAERVARIFRDRPDNLHDYQGSVRDARAAGNSPAAVCLCGHTRRCHEPGKCDDGCQCVAFRPRAQADSRKDAPMSERKQDGEQVTRWGNPGEMVPTVANGGIRAAAPIPSPEPAPNAELEQARARIAALEQRNAELEKALQLIIDDKEFDSCRELNHHRVRDIARAALTKPAELEEKPLR